MYKKITASIISLLMVSSGALYAQGYDDDDIYYNPDKAPKTVKKVQKQQQRPNAVIYYPAGSSTVQDYPSADSFTPSASEGLNVSVDKYNRRGIFAPDSANAASDSLSAMSDFANTRRIERFYNPEVVTSTNDNSLVEYYYAQPANVNIVVNSSWGWDPWYSSYWGWGYPYRAWYWGTWGNPWVWGPSWSWNWGPSWSWGWGPGWGISWGWGSGWYPGWGWGPSRPGWAYRPGSVGNVRPGTGYRPGYSGGSYRPSASGGYRPGSSGNSGYRTGRGIRGNASNSNYNSGYRRGSSNSNSTPNYNYNRGNSSRGSSWGTGSSGGYRGGGSTGGYRGGGGGRGRH